jgi:hypothetical protein
VGLAARARGYGVGIVVQAVTVAVDLCVYWVPLMWLPAVNVDP